MTTAAETIKSNGDLGCFSIILGRIRMNLINWYIRDAGRIDEVAGQGPMATQGLFFCLSWHCFEFGKGLFDWIEVGFLWRQDLECRARRPDPILSRTDTRLWLDRWSMTATSPVI